MFRRLLAVGAVGTIVAVSLALGGASGAGDASCGDWAPTAEGRPDRPGGRASYLVWHDGGGWHLRAVTPARHRAARFHGRIVSNAPIRRLRSRGRESDDKLSRSRSRISFDLRTRGGDADGFDFDVRCGSLRFELKPRSRAVRLGADGSAPARRFTAPDPGASGVDGEVVTGPTCPVEREGEDCSPRPIETTVDVFRPTQRDEPQPAAPEQSIATDGSGHFRVELAPGRYRLVPRPPDPGATGKPEDVTVSAGLMTHVTLTVDSGIRGPEGPPPQR